MKNAIRINFDLLNQHSLKWPISFSLEGLTRYWIGSVISPIEISNTNNINYPNFNNIICLNALLYNGNVMLAFQDTIKSQRVSLLYTTFPIDTLLDKILSLPDKYRIKLFFALEVEDTLKETAVQNHLAFQFTLYKIAPHRCICFNRNLSVINELIAFLNKLPIIFSEKIISSIKNKDYIYEDLKANTRFPLEEDEIPKFMMQIINNFKSSKKDFEIVENEGCRIILNSPSQFNLLIGCLSTSFIELSPKVRPYLLDELIKTLSNQPYYNQIESSDNKFLSYSNLG